MGIMIIRLGSPRITGEGLRIGTARRPPEACRRASLHHGISTMCGCPIWLPAKSSSRKDSLPQMMQIGGPL